MPRVQPSSCRRSRVRPLPGRSRGRLALGALLHPLGAFFRDDDIALLGGCGLVVDRFQRVRPGLAGCLAGAGRIELGAEAERVRQRRVVLTAGRDSLIDVLTGIAIGEKRRLGRRAQRPAGSLVVGKTRWDRCERNREVAAIAAPHADGAIGAGRRGHVGAGRRKALSRIVVAAAEQVGEEIAGARGGRRRCRIGILRAATVLRERDQDRTALAVLTAAGTAGPQPFQAACDLIEVLAHLLDLGVDRTALRRLVVEQREEAGAVAAHALGLLGDAIQLGLLPRGRVLIAADLLVLGGIAAAAAVDGRELRLESRADRIDRRAALRSRTRLGEGRGIQRSAAEQGNAG